MLSDPSSLFSAPSESAHLAEGTTTTPSDGTHLAETPQVVGDPNWDSKTRKDIFFQKLCRFDLLGFPFRWPVRVYLDYLLDEFDSITNLEEMIVGHEVQAQSFITQQNTISKKRVLVNLLFALALSFVTMFSICFASNLRWKSRRYFNAAIQIELL